MFNAFMCIIKQFINLTQIINHKLFFKIYLTQILRNKTCLEDVLHAFMFLMIAHDGYFKFQSFHTHVGVAHIIRDARTLEV